MTAAEVPTFKGDPWRGGCPECGSMALKNQWRSRSHDDVWSCKGCGAYDFTPVDRKEADDEA